MHSPSRCFLLIAMLAASGAVDASAQPSNQPPVTWEKITGTAVRKLKAGDAVQAEQLCRQAMALPTNTSPSDVRPGRTEALMGEIYRWQKKLDQAEQCFTNAVVLSESAARNNPQAAVPELENLANFYTFSRPRPAEVVRLSRRILTIAEQAPESPSEIAFRTRNLADAHMTLQQFAEAEPLYLRALELEEKSGGSASQYLLALADFYQRWSKGAEAERHAVRALKLAESGDGIDAALTRALCLDRLSAAQFIQTNLSGAEATCRKSLSLIEKNSGPRNADLIPRLTLLSDILCAKGDLAAADAELERALSLAEQAFGPEALDTASVLEKRAALLQKLKLPDKAREHASRAETIRKRAEEE